jgi:exonuclease III
MKYTINVMSYNIEYGGLKWYEKSGNMNYVKKYCDIITKNDVDIVAFQECKMKDIDISEMIAKSLGYYHQYFFKKTNFYKRKYYYQSIISKYPIVKVDEKKNLCRVNIQGQLVNIINIHLDDEPYIPYALKGIQYNNTPRDVSDLKESTYLSYMTKKDTIRNYTNTDYTIPTIVMGDFNEPSHLDYHYIHWKTSKYLLNNGYVDAARSIYPDAKNSPLYTVDLYDKKYSPERIDIIYANKYLKPVGFKNIHSKLSDHVPVIATYEMTVRKHTVKLKEKVKYNDKVKFKKNK